MELQARSRLDAARPLGPVVAEVMEKSLSTDPVRGLYWLASVRTSANVILDNQENLLLLNAVKALSDAAVATEVCKTRSFNDIAQLLQGLPDAALIATGSVPGELARLEVPSTANVTLVCAGIGAGLVKFNFDDPAGHGWTPVGLAIARWHLAGVLDPAQRGFDFNTSESLLAMSWVVNTALQHGYASSALDVPADEALPPGRLASPIGACMPAYRDAGGAVHDVWDLMCERIMADDLKWMTACARHDWGEVACGVLAARYAARLHDMALLEYMALNRQQRPETGAAGVPLANPVRQAIAEMVLLGGAPTAAQWAHRQLGHEDSRYPDSGMLPNLIYEFDLSTETEEIRLRTLKRLRKLGHDVVVAHEDVDHRNRMFSALPLWSALEKNEASCVAQLLEWGAATDVMVANAHDVAHMDELVERLEAQGRSEEAVRTLRAAVARRAAWVSLADMGSSRPAR